MIPISWVCCAWNQALVPKYGLKTSQTLRFRLPRPRMPHFDRLAPLRKHVDRPMHGSECAPDVHFAKKPNLPGRGASKSKFLLSILQGVYRGWPRKTGSRLRILIPRRTQSAPNPRRGENPLRGQQCREFGAFLLGDRSGRSTRGDGIDAHRSGIRKEANHRSSSGTSRQSRVNSIP